MIIGSAILSLRIIGVQSLKEKRAVLLSLIRRTRNKYNAAIAEVGSQNLWQRADLGIAVISSTAKHAEVQLQNVVRFIEAEPRLEVVSLETEIL
ncbi:MAG: DUF503 domain-containing protein [Firmicutes bacterium]|nr:DUF503 domain-containing protein [Bacillota bacterium]NLL87876.1 DUF503 domain-containing protein [Bacillota bacterium]